MHATSALLRPWTPAAAVLPPRFHCPSPIGSGRRPFSSSPTPPWPAAPTQTPLVPSVPASPEIDPPPTAGSGSLQLKRAPPFDSYKLVAKLRESGLTEAQSVVMMEALIMATMDAQDASQTNLISTYRADLSGMKVQMNEKIFNASLKYDMQQKHTKEMLKGEVDGLKSDALVLKKSLEADTATFRSEMRMLLKTDLIGLQTQDRSFFQSQLDKEKALLIGELEKMENRLTRYLIGFVVSVGALVLAALRLLQ